ncbi:MAG: NADH:ubiquinone reductase (Na(+)-transporting) subunit D [Phycisphaerae bacterium]|jgi:Na+-transporting NADH:ubiquinone oxidoreductase subunit D|nr:NADH:ubiquinone reductase (Na(+)-transporting) subunit D [Phycisphaerae bacterium]
MSDSSAGIGGCTGGVCCGKGKETFKAGLWVTNPVAIQVLGICSALAVTTTMMNSLVMSIALTFVCVGSNLFVSLLRDVTPRRIRMIAEVAIIATFVIIFDLLLKAFYFEMSEQLGPYVGLIITNCIVMGRAEAFALQNPPVVSMLDGFANGLGYTIVLCAVGFFRELFGAGQLFGITIMETVSKGGWYPQNVVMILAPGAFITLGFLIALYNYLSGANDPDKEATS